MMKAVFRIWHKSHATIYAPLHRIMEAEDVASESLLPDLLCVHSKSFHHHLGMKTLVFLCSCLFILEPKPKRKSAIILSDNCAFSLVLCHCDTINDPKANGLKTVGKVSNLTTHQIILETNFKLCYLYMLVDSDCNTKRRIR